MNKVEFDIGVDSGDVFVFVFIVVVYKRCFFGLRLYNVLVVYCYL